MNPFPEKVLDSKVSVFGYLCLCLNIFFFSSLLVVDPTTFQALTREDYWVENLTAVWFLLAGLLLFVTALVERSFFRRCVYILGAMAMVFAAGEEISWGQRIFGFATPDFLMHLNESKEFNVHNISNDMFGIIYLNGTLILCMATSASFFCRKDRLFGIPLPSTRLLHKLICIGARNASVQVVFHTLDGPVHVHSSEDELHRRGMRSILLSQHELAFSIAFYATGRSILLMLGFLLILSYISGATLERFSEANLREYVKSTRRAFGFIVVEGEDGLLLLFLIFALFSRQVALVIASAATLALVWALTYVNYHGKVSIGSPHVLRGSLFEMREYLFGIGCLFYSLELMLAQGRFAAISRVPFTGLKLRGRRIPFWLMTCSLVIAGSIGLCFFQYFNAMAATTAIEEAY